MLHVLGMAVWWGGGVLCTPPLFIFHIIQNRQCTCKMIALNLAWLLQCMANVNFLDWVDETLYLLMQVIKWVFQRLPNMGFHEIPIAEANYQLVGAAVRKCRVSILGTPTLCLYIYIYIYIFQFIWNYTDFLQFHYFERFFVLILNSFWIDTDKWFDVRR